MLHVDCHITAPYYFTVEEAHHEIDTIDKWINEHFDNRVEFFIHTDACVDASCKICNKSDCPVRKHPFEKEIPWNLDTVIKNQKHVL